MKLARILVQNAQFEDVCECSLRDYFYANDYSASERRDLIQRLRADQLTPGRPPQPTHEMFSVLSLLDRGGKSFVLRFFRSAKDARAYRHEHGTGGWIFVPDSGADCVLFPPEFTPSDIFKHQATRGQSGRLIGSQ